MRARNRCWPALLALVLLALAGCVSLPTRGPVEKVEGLEPACQSCVNVDVAPPAPGASKLEIVDGYLRANANFQAGYTVAKQYLTRSAAERWSPADSVTIYSLAPKLVGEDVEFHGRVVGSLDRGLSYTRRNDPFNYTFQLVQEGGEWRIGKPIPGLLVQEDAFTSRYTPYDLYFVGSAGMLVPDPIYLPPLRNPATFASALVTGLLDGPSERLQAAVETAVPVSTTLSVESVTITDGVAEVPLTGPGLQQMDDAARSLLAAQLAYTLRQLTTVQKVLLLVDSVPFRVPQSESRGLAFAVADIAPELNPIPVTGVEQPLHVVRDGAVLQVGANTDHLQIEKVPGALGSGRFRVDSLAASVTGSELAVVTDNRTRLRRSLAEGANPSTVLAGVTGLLRPQFSRNGDIWAVGQRKGRQTMWMVTGDRANEVDAPVLAEGRVLAFRVSPDGSRIALLIQQGSRTRLGLALVKRTDTGAVAVLGWRALELNRDDGSEPASPEPQIKNMRDVAWADPTTLLVLTTTATDTPYMVTEISQDASSIQSEPPAGDWEPVELTVLLRSGTAVVRTRDGRVFRDEGQQWRELVTGVSAAAYPG